MGGLKGLCIKDEGKTSERYNNPIIKMTMMITPKSCACLGSRAENAGQTDLPMRSPPTKNSSRTSGSVRIKRSSILIALVCSVYLFAILSPSQGQVTAQCPLRCLCFRTTVRCMFLHLEKVPDIPEDTTVLDLRFNRIREIPVNHFKHLKKLETLLLNNNHIVHLRNDAFSGLENLRFLYLYKNRIRDIDSNAFRNLTNLEQLYLHYNYIQDFSSETFQNLTSLQRLFLQNNKIQRIPPGAFDGLNKLIRLRLDSNALICDCSIMSLAQMLADHPGAEAAAYCEEPSSMHGKSVMAMNEIGIRCRTPKITEEPRDIEVNFGNTVYFRCRADGEPDPTIVWMRNSNEISTAAEPRYSVLRDGTLMIANAQDEDVGTYECVAKSDAGLVKSRKAKMVRSSGAERTASRPRFIVVPLDQEVVEGTNAVINCEATGYPRPSIQWHVDTNLLEIGGRFQVSPEGSLTITNVSKEDEGVYRCSATNPLGNLSAIAEVRVATPPKWIVTPLEQTASYGERVEFKCEAVGTPFPTITWLHNGQPLASERFRQNEEGSLLTINPIQEGDEGEYTCRAANGLGTIETNTNLRVSSGTPPVFTDFLQQKSFSATSGSQLRFPCSASGTPPPTILWRRNRLTIVENLKTSILPSGTLILNNFSPAEDSGTYVCSAFNDHGFITAPQVVIRGNRITVTQEENQITVENELIRDAFRRAKGDVEQAESDSVDLLFSNSSRNEIRSPFDLLRLARFPRPEARQFARPAEIYERAIHIIQQEIQKGMNFTLPGDFRYEHIFNPSQIELLGRLSGCISHRKPKTNCTEERCFHSKYRSIDGTCNNLGHSMWGSSYTPFVRLLNPEYENGFNLPKGWDPEHKYNGIPLPLARSVTNKVITTDAISPDSVLTHMVMQWGQFLDHDLDHSLPSLSVESFGERISCRRTCENVAPCFPMQAPSDDTRIRTRRCMEFTRSAAVCGSGITSILANNMQQREQINQLTSFIDGSQVYGSSEEELQSLRNISNPGFLRNGIYMAPDKALMPFATDGNFVDCRRNFRESDVGCFLAGDIRSNEQLGLLAMHTIWFRQHNFLAEKLRQLNPRWDEETLFQEARKIVGAQMQHITYAEWLPMVIGKEGMNILGAYEGYDPQVNPTISNEFATAALRFGHTLINPTLRRLDSSFQTIREGDVPLRSAFFSPWRLVEEGGVDPLMRGLFSTPAKLKTPTQILNSHLTNELFTHAHLVALDLASMNIQRGRDHGLPSYNEYRTLCNLTRARSFDDLKSEIPDEELRRKLAEVYTHVDNIDLWVGGVAEQPLTEDSRVGPTFRCILIDQFRRLRDGDRFYYENPSVFKPEQLTQIKQTTLARVLCDNGDAMAHIKRNVFLMDSALVNCRLIPQIQLSFWSQDCCGNGDGGLHSPGSCSSSASSALSNTFYNLESNAVETNDVRRKRDLLEAGFRAGLEESIVFTEKLKTVEEALVDVRLSLKDLKKKITHLQKMSDEGASMP